MKKLTLTRIAAGMVLLASIWAFTPKSAITVYVVDSQSSTLSWNAKKVTGAHYGKVAISSGEIQVEGKGIQGGSFNIDMTTITVEDISNKDSNLRLVNHLKSDDFFSVDKFPQSHFTITSFKQGKDGQASIKGKLSIKGISQEIEFPANIKMDGKNLTATAKIVIDRTKFDIRYRSGSFFDSLGDKMIYDDFELDLSLVARDKSSS